jgi:hypothetical protein
VIAREAVSYYATELLHLRLLEVKAKQGVIGQTSAEKDLRKAVADDEFNVPQPISIHLALIGAYCDKMGKETLLEVPSLPTVVVQGFGGYHANAVTTDRGTILRNSGRHGYGNTNPKLSHRKTSEHRIYDVPRRKVLSNRP